MLYSGGKFAAAIFHKNKPIAHKTIRRYTVRAKQGGSQSFKDSSCGGMSGPKSAGASLRRHGEQAIRADVANLLHSKWLGLLQRCDLIFTWTPFSNRDIFFNSPTVSATAVDKNDDKDSSSEEPPAAESDLNAFMDTPISSKAEAACTDKMGFNADDSRLRRIPYRVKGITYACIKDLHRDISRFEVYDPDAEPEFLALSNRRQLKHFKETNEPFLQTTESGRFVYRAAKVKTKHKKFDDVPDISDSFENTEVDVTRKSSDSESEFFNEKEVIIDRLKELSIKHESWHRKLRVSVAAGDCETIEDLLNPSSNNGNVSFSSSLPSTSDCVELLNHPICDGRTILNVAVEFQAEPMVIYSLLKNGADPAVKSSQGQTPYSLAQSLNYRPIMKVFKKFRSENPDKYDYTLAEIPDRKAELSEANKEALKAKKQAQKIKIMNKVNEEAEKLRKQEESKRFNALSDREKRALMAERRLLKTMPSEDKSKPVLMRCELCSADISGKVPFNYLDFNFCSSKCMRTHRLEKNRKS